MKTRDQIACIRRACRITEQAIADVQKSLAPGVRQMDLSAAFVRQAFELGATANMLEAIWQVMPTSKAEGVWTTTGDLALPLLTTERELAAGDVLWTDVEHHLRGVLLGLRPHLAGGRGRRRRASTRSSTSGARSSTRCSQ